MRFRGRRLVEDDGPRGKAVHSPRSPSRAGRRFTPASGKAVAVTKSRWRTSPRDRRVARISRRSSPSRRRTTRPSRSGAVGAGPGAAGGPGPPGSVGWAAEIRVTNTYAAAVPANQAAIGRKRDANTMIGSGRLRWGMAKGMATGRTKTTWSRARPSWPRIDYGAVGPAAEPLGKGLPRAGCVALLRRLCRPVLRSPVGIRTSQAPDFRAARQCSPRGTVDRRGRYAPRVPLRCPRSHGRSAGPVARPEAVRAASRFPPSPRSRASP